MNIMSIKRVAILTIALGVIALGAIYFVMAPKSDLIRVASPKNNDMIKNPITVTGEARGTWYFEASFPVRVLDATGKELGVAPAEAQGEWMTQEFVPFKAVINFSTPSTETGWVVFQKDNPSGLPEHDDELRVRVRFDRNP